MNGDIKIRKSPHLKKRLGQFLLKDESAAHRIVEALPPDQLIVEIGPGDGALTTQLLYSERDVVACELDQEMVDRLSTRFEHRRNFRLIHGDILQLDWKNLSLDGKQICVTGNLPYHLAGAILFSIYDLVRDSLKDRISGMVVMVQKEVGRRITAEPGNRDYGALTLLTRYHATPEYLFTVPRASFKPVPKVDGAVVKLAFHDSGNYPEVDYNKFRRLVKGCFAQRRKMLRNSIQTLGDLPPGWQDLNYDFTLRPENLSFTDFSDLTNDLERLRLNAGNIDA